MKTNSLSNSALSIGSISDRTGLAPSAIRYYEDEGLIAPGRNASGHRRYARSDIRRLSFVQISQGLGFTIAEIREAVDFCRYYAAQARRFPRFPPTAPRPKPTGRASRAASGPNSTPASPGCSSCGPSSTAASAAAACRSRPARSTTRATGQNGSAPGRATSWATPRPTDPLPKNKANVIDKPCPARPRLGRSHIT